jgi:hypothetical protein
MVWCDVDKAKDTKLLLTGLILLFLLSPQSLKADNYYPKQDVAYKPSEEETFIISLRNRAVAQKGKYVGSCVIGVRQLLGVGRDKVGGLASSTKVNSQTPEVGAIIKLNMSKYGHVGVVLDFTSTQISYYDTNWSWNGRADIRTINITDKRILGYQM